MCGLKPCRKCAAKVAGRRKKTSMARTKISQRGVINAAKKGAQTYLGYMAGRALVNNIPQLNTNPIFGIGAQLLTAVVLSSGRGIQQDIAVGMSVSAMKGVVDTFAGDLASTIGISGPYGSFMTPGVSGKVGKHAPVIRVQ